MKHEILIVDDDRSNLLAVKRFLELSGFKVVVASSGKIAIELVKKRRSDFSVCFIDYHMPEMNGPIVIAEIKRIRPKQQIVALTADGSGTAVKNSFIAGAVDFAEKSISNDEFLALVRRYCEKFDEVFRTIQDSEFEQPEEVSSLGMVGHSESLTECARLIKRYAPLDATVLILGETGTGKELVAKGLHRSSARASGPFVAINCNELPSDLVESILFGHRKGSFTGAIQDQIGRFQAANGGTLFLDEIGDLPLRVQAKLLRALQEREVTPVGATSAIKIDVRIVAATHRNLAQMTESGEFREDLFYRLRMLEIRTPSLRERPNDIEPLAAHFTRRACAKLGIERTLQRSAVEVLKRYKWPGNVRELEAEIESHLARCVGDEVTREDLDAKFFAPSALGPATLDDLDAEYASKRKEHICATVRNSKTKTEAARKLGISPTLLQFYLGRASKRDSAAARV